MAVNTSIQEDALDVRARQSIANEDEIEKYIEEQ